jgi:hypothetical protein
MRSGHAGPLTMGRIVRGPSGWTRAAGWGDLTIGLRPSACWTKGSLCQSSCLRWCSEIGEGIERRVASSPSPQQRTLSVLFHDHKINSKNSDLAHHNQLDSILARTTTVFN